MEVQTMTDTYSNPLRRHLPRREQPHRAVRLQRAPDSQIEMATPRTWPARGLSINLDDFEIRVFGAVRHSLGLDWSTLTALPTQSIKANLDSRSVRRPGRTWRGASLLHILQSADFEPAAIRVTLFSDGGYYTRYGIHELLQEESVLAYEVDSRPLTRSDGGPVRLVVPQLDPWRCAKWVRGIVIEDESAL